MLDDLNATVIKYGKDTTLNTLFYAPAYAISEQLLFASSHLMNRRVSADNTSFSFIKQTYLKREKDEIPYQATATRIVIVICLLFLASDCDLLQAIQPPAHNRRWVTKGPSRSAHTHMAVRQAVHANRPRRPHPSVPALRLVAPAPCQNQSGWLPLAWLGPGGWSLLARARHDAAPKISWPLP